jgi:hypothetical protein
MNQAATRKSVGAAAAVLGALYINAYYGFSTDFNQLLQDRAFKKRLAQRIASLGNDTTIYHMLEMAGPDATALWFEGRSWTFAEMRMGKFHSLAHS